MEGAVSTTIRSASKLSSGLRVQGPGFRGQGPVPDLLVVECEEEGVHVEALPEAGEVQLGKGHLGVAGGVLAGYFWGTPAMHGAEGSGAHGEEYG